MTIAFDAYTSRISNQGTPITVTHTPVSTPQGILVLIAQATASDDTVTGVTYGGVAMSEMSNSPFLAVVSGESAVLYAYFLGSDVPTGTQPAVVTVDAVRGRLVTAISLTGADDLEENIVSQLLDSAAAPSPINETLSLNSVESFVAIALMSGRAVVSQVGTLTGWDDIGEGDAGDNVVGVYKYNTVDSVDVVCGFTQSSTDDALLLGVAIRESSGSSVTGTIAIVEADDVHNLSGSLQFIGTLSNTEESDGHLLNGVVLQPITGTINTTEENDNHSAVGVLQFSGVLAYTEGDDLHSMAGALEFTGVINTTEENDNHDASGVLQFSGVLAYNEDGDSHNLIGTSGNDDVTGSIVVIEADDVHVIDGVLKFAGSIDIIEADDNHNLSGAVALGVDGVIAYLEDNDAHSLNRSVVSGDVFGYYNVDNVTRLITNEDSLLDIIAASSSKADARVNMAAWFIAKNIDPVTYIMNVEETMALSRLA